MIKACFFDIDGTLVSHTLKKVPESTLRSLIALREKGIKIFMSTGRHLQELGKLPLEGIRFDGYVTLNGQLCADNEKKIIYRRPLQEAETKALLEIFEGKKEPLMLVEENRLYVNFINDTVRRAQEEISTPLPEVAPYDGAPVYMAVAFIRAHEEEGFKPLLPKGCKMTRWGSGGVDIISQKGGKVAGLERMMDAYQLRREEIMAIGDGENDIDMLRFAGIGIAMGNAPSQVKETADYVTDHIDEDGVMRALKHFGLIGEK